MQQNTIFTTENDTKTDAKIRSILDLTNSPQLELVCPQTRSKQPQETKAINHNHISTSFKKTNAMAQAKSGTTKA